MTQEDKQLLLQDLCARLPYGVKIELTWWVMGEGASMNTTLEPDQIDQLLNDEDGDTEIKPYLRPLSSMTEEEKDYVVKHSLGYTANIGGGKKDERLYFHFKAESYDWLNKNMFDFRGLIPKGLAISTEVFNPYK